MTKSWCLLRHYVLAHMGHLLANTCKNTLKKIYIVAYKYCDLNLHIHYIITLCVKILVKSLIKGKWCCGSVDTRYS